MFGQIALSVLAVRENNYGQRLGAARKAGSFEGTLPRLFLLRNPESFCRRRCGSWAKHQLHSDSKPSNPNLRDLTQLPTEWLPTHKT
jgi:hypothetical protein